MAAGGGAAVENVAYGVAVCGADAFEQDFGASTRWVGATYNSNQPRPSGSGTSGRSVSAASLSASAALSAAKTSASSAAGAAWAMPHASSHSRAGRTKRNIMDGFQ
uniref:Uncharacterized protein n=1 Tax=Conchiformibius kuhniae TaxID=211502 RepID=A0A8T9MWQ6_9NEIS|nr:hypothetical protein LVJ77_00480 [Conchiformibius kuhniae]